MNKFTFSFLFLIALTSVCFAQWVEQKSGTSNRLLTVYFLNAELGWAAGDDGTVLKTTDGGLNWVALSLGTLDKIQQHPDTQGGWLWPIFFIDSNMGWTAGDPLFGMFKSTNGGFSWSSTSLPVVERVYSIVFIDSLIGWLSAAQGQIARSFDGGITWENVQSGNSQHLRDIYFLDYTNGWCVGYEGTIVYSIDGGNNWIDQSSGTSSNLFSVQFVDEQTGWIVGDNGVILKTNNGGIPVGVVEMRLNQPEEYSLQQNFPNPFNPATKIRFTIPVTGFTTLKVFDVLGNEVASLISEEKPTGSFEVEFNASALSSGIYYYKLVAGDFVEVKKMILLK